MAEADRADIGVGVSSKFRWAAAECLAVGLELYMGLNANHCLVINLQGARMA